jgi:hypothetical protein
MIGVYAMFGRIMREHFPMCYEQDVQLTNHAAITFLGRVIHTAIDNQDFLNVGRKPLQVHGHPIQTLTGPETLKF